MLRASTFFMVLTSVLGTGACVDGGVPPMENEAAIRATGSKADMWSDDRQGYLDARWSDLGSRLADRVAAAQAHDNHDWSLLELTHHDVTHFESTELGLAETRCGTPELAADSVAIGEVSFDTFVERDLLFVFDTAYHTIEPAPGPDRSLEMAEELRTLLLLAAGGADRIDRVSSGNDCAESWSINHWVLTDSDLLRGDRAFAISIGAGDE